MSFANVDLGYRVPRFRSKDVGSLYLSDGGHIENLGLYPLVRRNCRNIIVIDAEHEEKSPYVFASYDKVKRALMDEMQRTLTVSAIDNKAFDPATPVVTGQITGKSDTPPAMVYYVKLSIDPQRRGEVPFNNPALGPYFPQDPTSNQNFDALRFTAYRELGYVVARDSDDLKTLAGRLENP
jgi:hypothetical protein